MPDARSQTKTSDRILDAAIDAFGTDGIDSTSLDDIAGSLGITKQAILYWFPSKDLLLDAAIDRSALELQVRLGRALVTAPGGFARIEALVKASFRLAARRPAMLGLMREINRKGPPTSTRMTTAMASLLDRAATWLDEEMAAGRLRYHDPHLLVLMAYSAITGMATEVEVLRALGDEPDLASLIRRRNALIELLRAALVP